MSDVEPLPEVGRRLSAARLRRGLSQGQIAMRAGVATSYLSRVENGKIQPSFRTVMRIQRALGVGFEEIAGPDPPKKRNGPCPVSKKGRCLLDLIRSEALVRHAAEEAYSPREVRLLRKVATWLKISPSDRVRALETLVDDLIEGSERANRRHPRG